MLVMSNSDLDAAKKLGLTGIKKYWKCARQVEIKLDWLHKQILSLATFMRHSYKVYNNEKVIVNMNARQDIDPKQVSVITVSSFFIQLHGFI